jgi:hypothetical protein
LRRQLFRLRYGNNMGKYAPAYKYIIYRIYYNGNIVCTVAGISHIQAKKQHRRKRQNYKQQKSFRRGFVFAFFGFSDLCHQTNLDTFSDCVYYFADNNRLYLLFISKRIFFVFAFYRDKLFPVIFRTIPAYICLFETGVLGSDSNIRGDCTHFFTSAYEKQRKFPAYKYIR